VGTHHTRSLWGLAALTAGALAVFHGSRRSRLPSWQGRVVLITGGARGLGFALARCFADRGAIVWLAARHGDQLDRAVDRLRLPGAEIHAHVVDVRDREAVEALVAAVVARHGRLDAVVNNAGVITAMPFDNAELSDFAESLDTHFWGPLHVIRAALPWLRRQPISHIINVSSIGGRVGVPHLAPYCAGKFALAGLSDVLRAELAGDGVWVTLATPGLMRTGSVGNVRVRGDHVAEARWFAALSAMPLTSQHAMRAAGEIVTAAGRRRAVVMPGWQARLQHAANTLAPELTAAVLQAVSRRVLPNAVPGPSPSRAVSELDLGWAAPLVSAVTARAYNQPVPSAS
jgi:NAD(P)-dependent dehydrogenase (short-subunit alcohol dehydrogenase family)